MIPLSSRYSMDFTIVNNSGGYHGHQIKDVLGGICIGKLLGLRYRSMRYAYLDHFSIGDHADSLSWWQRRMGYKRVRRVSGPLWDGISDYEEALAYFAPIIDAPDGTLLLFDKALRIHPHQTIPWYDEGKLKNNIWREIVHQTSRNYQERHQLTVAKGPIRVAMHISRGVDYNRDRFPEHFSSSYQVRYMFSMEYFLRITEQIVSHYGENEVVIDIFTEQLNSEDVSRAFSALPYATVHIGKNRKEKDDRLIHGIFNRFVMADILVTCNSSFSAMCSYFREGKTTIYHPHLHLEYLPAPEYLATDEHGNFDTSLLRSSRS